MSIAAFTNAVGYHLKYDTVYTNSSFWYSFGYEGTSTPVAREVAVAMSGKSLTVHSDRRTPTAYQRRVVNLVNEKPHKVRTVDMYQGKVFGYQDISQPFSLRYEPASITPPLDFYEQASNNFSAAVTRARSKLRGNQLQNGAAIGEARRTANQVASTFEQALHAFQAVRRGVLKEVPAALGLTRDSVLSGKAAAQRWLEFAYTWRPLISDMHGNIQLVSKILKKTQKQHFSVAGGYGTSVSASYTDGEFEVSNTVNLNAKCAYSVDLIDESVFYLDSAGMLNPLSIAWELSPYSFIVDWFVPIGEFLTSLSATLGLGFNSGYVSEVYQGTFKARRRAPLDQGIPQNGAYTILLDAGEIEVQYFGFNRTPLAGFEMPQLYARKNPFSTSHILSAVALYRQTFR